MVETSFTLEAWGQNETLIQVLTGVSTAYPQLIIWKWDTYELLPLSASFLYWVLDSHESKAVQLYTDAKVGISIFEQDIYRKIRKISPGAYIFQRPFWRGLFLEGPIFGGASLRREICVSKSIGLALWWSKLSLFALFYFVFEGNFPSTSPRRLIFGGVNGGFFCVTGLGGLYLEGLIHGGAYFRNFYGISILRCLA